MNEVIKVTDLSFEYPDGTRALNAFSMTIFKGETVGIIGPNGAGKSTLLLHLNGIHGLDDQVPPSVRIEGIPVTRRNIAEIRKKVGIVFQDPDDQLFTPTVFDDVAFGPLNEGMRKEEIPKIVRASLKKVGMEACINRTSHHLSFGEKKKISLATILSCSPSILILDEPTGNLDPHSRREFISLIKSLELTILIATHDLELVLELCHRVLIINRGQNIASGDSRTALSNGPLMEENGLEIPLSLRT